MGDVARVTIARLALALLVVATPAAADGPPDPPGQAPPAAPAPAAPPLPLKTWLTHKEWTVRSIFAFHLRRRPEPEVIGPIAEALAAERDLLVQASLLSALAGRPRVELVAEGGCTLAGALVALLDSPEPVIASRARAVLARVPPIQLGERDDLLRGWWERGKDALLREQQHLKAERARQAAAPGGAPTAPGESRTVERETPDLYALFESLSRDGLDLVLVIDSTGSMGPVIAAAKAQCQSLVRRLRRLVPAFRVGLVTYDDGARLRVPLTRSAEELQKGLDMVAAAGGGDYEEGVDKGLYLAQRPDQVGWSRRAHRLAVVVGDAPPHEGDVAPLLKRLGAAGEDDLFDHPFVVHTVSTDPQGVPHFGAIARAGRGAHVTLGRTDLLAHELVLLTFGARHRAVAEAWLEDLERLDDLLAR
jgi:Mg-chelatase subunit ChlD